MINNDLFFQIIRIFDAKGGILILLYHGFFQGEGRGIENYHGKHLEIEKFREQVAYLKNHYRVLTAKELLDIYALRESVPDPLVVLTFDDGYRSNYKLAFPILQEFKIPAILFVATDFIDRKECLWVDRVEYAINQTQRGQFQWNTETFSVEGLDQKIKADRRIKNVLKLKPKEERDYLIRQLEECLNVRLTFENAGDIYAPLDWEEIREMIGSGFVGVGSHTSSHTIMTSCGLFEMAEEVKNSKKRIEAMTGRDCTMFAYPNGEDGDFNRDTRTIVRNAGFSCAFTTVVGSNEPTSDCFELKRLNIHNSGQLPGFVTTLSSVGRFLRKVKYEGLP